MSPRATSLFPLLLAASLAWAAPQDPASSDVDPSFQASSELSTPHSPEVITRSVLEDSRGDVWAATWSGVLRYEGARFTNVTKQEGLRPFRSFSLLEDSAGHIWIGTVGAGVYRYDGTRFTNYTSADGLASDTVLSLFEDAEGHLWLGGHGVTKYDGSSFTAFGEADGFTERDVASIAQAPDGSLWFGTRGALFRYDGEAFANFTEEQQVEVHPNSYTPVVFDRAGKLWFGGATGLYQFDGEQVRHLLEPSVYSLLLDSSGQLWFVGGDLVGQQRQPGFSVLNRFDPAGELDLALAEREQVSIHSGAVFELSEDRQGRIWFGTGGGVGRLAEGVVEYL